MIEFAHECDFDMLQKAVSAPTAVSSQFHFSFPVSLHSLVLTWYVLYFLFFCLLLFYHQWSVLRSVFPAKVREVWAGCGEADYLQLFLYRARLFLLKLTLLPEQRCCIPHVPFQWCWHLLCLLIQLWLDVTLGSTSEGLCTCEFMRCRPDAVSMCAYVLIVF